MVARRLTAIRQGRCSTDEEGILIVCIEVISIHHSRFSTASFIASCRCTARSARSCCVAQLMSIDTISSPMQILLFIVAKLRIIIEKYTNGTILFVYF